MFKVAVGEAVVVKRGIANDRPFNGAEDERSTLPLTSWLMSESVQILSSLQFRCTNLLDC